MLRRVRVQKRVFAGVQTEGHTIFYTHVTSLDNSKRIQMKYPGHFKFLDIELFSPSTRTTMELIRNMFLLKLDICLFFLREGLTFCDYVWRGGGSKIGQKSVTSFMDGP